MSPLTSLASGKARSHFRLGREKDRNTQEGDRKTKERYCKRKTKEERNSTDKRMTRERERERERESKVWL